MLVKTLFLGCEEGDCANNSYEEVLLTEGTAYMFRKPAFCKLEIAR